jgi:hypothetical protein
MADERDRLRRQLGLSPTSTPVTADADPLAAIQAAVAASKNKVSEKNAEIARIALEQAVNTGNTRAASDAAAKLADAEGVTGAAKAAAIGDARKDAQATVESDREASKPTDDPGPGSIWSYSVSEKRWKKIKVSNVTESVADTTGYKVVNGVLQFNGQPFTGTYNGQTYENGIVKSAADTTGSEYLNVEDGYRQVYYGIGQNDLVAYVLDPQQQFQKIERQVAASEIGVAAARQDLTAGVSVAEQLAAQGVTQAEAQRGYATIADILPTAEKLSDIYGSTMDTYGQSEAEQEVFNSLASAQRKRQGLTAREIASFSGAAGVNRTSLTTPKVGQY